MVREYIIPSQSSHVCCHVVSYIIQWTMNYSQILLAASGLLKLARMLNIWYTDRREAYWQLVYCCKLSNKMLIPSQKFHFTWRSSFITTSCIYRVKTPTKRWTYLFESAWWQDINKKSTKLGKTEQTVWQVSQRWTHRHVRSDITLAASGGKHNVTVWRPSVRPSVPSFYNLNGVCGAYSTWLTRGQHAMRPSYISVRVRVYIEPWWWWWWW